MLDDKVGVPVSYLGKIGIIADWLSSNNGGVDYVVFESAESIVRSLGATSSETVPLVPDVLETIPVDKFIADADEKIEYVKTKLKNKMENGLQEMKTTAVRAFFSTPYIIVSDTKDALVIKDVFGTVSIAFHRNRFEDIDSDTAAELANRRYMNSIEGIVAMLNMFKDKVRKHD